MLDDFFISFTILVFCISVNSGRLFVIASSLFAIKEKCAIIPGTVEDVAKLILEIRQLNSEHHILDKLRAITAAIYHENQIPDTRGYCILQLNYVTQNLRIWPFRPSEFEDATIMYDELERSKGNESLDVVLIRGTSFREIKNAYPNYFLDIREFSYLIEGYLMFD